MEQVPRRLAEPAKRVPRCPVTFIVSAGATMPFLAYIAIIVVGFSGILLELNWLTSAPPQPKPAVQAAASTAVTTAQAVSVPKAPAADTASAADAVPAPVAAAQTAPKPPTDGPNKVLSPIYPTTAGAPKFEAADNTPKPAEPAPSQASTAATPPAPTPQPVLSALQTTTNVTTVVDTMPVRSAPETTGTATRDADDAKPASVVASATADKDNAASAQAAIAPAAVTNTAAAGRCDIRACASAYSSFRESDCTYQPFSGPRRVCSMSPDANRRAVESPDAHGRAAETKRRPRVAHERVEADADDLSGVEAAVRRLESGRSRSYRAESRPLPADIGGQVIDDDDSVVIMRRNR